MFEVRIWLERSFSATVNQSLQALALHTTRQQLGMPLAVVALGAQGPMGISSGLQLVAPAAISGQRAVYRAADGLRVASFDQGSTLEVIAITTGAVAAGAVATVQAADEMTEPTWAWQPGLPVWLGLNGVLTQTVPAAGAQVEVGIATAATKLIVRIQPPIYLN